MRSEHLALLCVAVLISTVTSCGGDSTGPAQPARLVFSVQTSSATAGASLAPAPQVTVQDAQGNVLQEFDKGAPALKVAEPSAPYAAQPPKKARRNR